MKIKLSKSQWEGIGKKAGWMKKSMEIPIGDPITGPQKRSRDWMRNQPPSEYTYHINLNERGSFFADVRNSNEKTVFQIKAGNELAPDESSIFEDGFMKNINDMDGLKQHLISLGIMKEGQKLIDVQPGER